MQIRKGDLFYADLTPVIGSEQGGVRPVLIIQNDIGNRHSPTVIAAAVTSCANKNPLPTHVAIGGAECGLRRSSTVLLEQVRTIDRSRLREYIAQHGALPLGAAALHTGGQDGSAEGGGPGEQH